MIISASRRTDIPAFYGPWFINRVRAGFFISKNPFNPAQTKRVSLLPKDVDAFVFWSKNPKPFIPCLSTLNEMGFHYYFQYTLNDYPFHIEPGLPDVSERIATFQSLADMIGCEKVIWRYDPILVSDQTPVAYHMERFHALAEALSGHTKRVVISFMDRYKKIEAKFDRTKYRDAPLIKDITRPEYKAELGELAMSLSRTAGCYGMSMASCCEQIDLVSYGIVPGSCIDPLLINRIGNRLLPIKTDPNQRPGCLCAPSIDMGAYHCCPHLCRYCYANMSTATVMKNHGNHDPGKEVLY